MNKILIFVFTSICLNSYSQNITLDELIALRSKGATDVELFLSKKNWQLFHIKAPENGSLGEAYFAYNKQSSSDAAESFIAYYYPPEYEKFLLPKPTRSNRITIQIINVAVYNTFLARVDKLGYKLTSSEIDNDGIEKVYSGNIHTIKIKTKIEKKGNSSLNTRTVTAYLITIMSTKDYLEYLEYLQKEEEAARTIEEAAASARKGYNN